MQTVPACIARCGAENSGVKAEHHDLMQALFVPETRVGFWFLGTRTWETRVIRVALADLLRLQPAARWPLHPVILDVGCGQGKSFRPLFETFAPQRIVAITSRTSASSPPRSKPKGRRSSFSAAT